MLKYYVADAFADAVFEGNPAGVCVLDEWLSNEKMMKIAMENNLSETAFVVKEGELTYGIRWFTPVGEIDLCGHATFGTSYILFRFEEQAATEINFNTKKCGYHLTVEKHGDMLTMNFPSIIPQKFEYADYMGEGVGAVPSEVFRTERDLLLVYDSDETILNMKPDFSKVKEFPVGLSVYVTAKSSCSDYDIVARAFWPKINVNEDPVCGSMYCALVPFWRERLGKDNLISRQLSQRGGTVHCEYCGDRVKISGKGALYLVGNILIDESGTQMIKQIAEIDNTTIYDIVVNDKHSTGISINIPNTKLEILQVRCAKGMMFCGIFNPDVLEKLQVPAGVFSAPTFEVMLENKPIYLSKAALHMGANSDMTGKELLELLSFQ